MSFSTLDSTLVECILVESLKPPHGTFGRIKVARICAAFPYLSLDEVEVAILEVRAELQARADMMLAREATKH
jgi:hypothetical protein